MEAAAHSACVRDQQYTMADVVRRFGPGLRASGTLSREKHAALSAIARCRTAALGGHVLACAACGTQHIAYNSCRSRSCPRCQGRARRRWVAARLRDLLPIPYFHVVFTLPHELLPLVRYNERVMYGLLFRAAAETLLAFGQNRLGGEVGVTGVLHTWSQTLLLHPHLHCLVTGGALSREGQWRSSGAGYLFPTRALGVVFRAKYLDGVAEAARRGELAGLEQLGPEGSLARLLARLRRRRWVVYCKRPFAGPECVVKYLGRYTHRIAISDARLLDVSERTVTFSYRDRRAGDRTRTMTLPGEQFLARFLQHVLPARFVRIRHYGLLAPGRSHKLARCRELLATQASAAGAQAGPGAVARTEEVVARSEQGAEAEASGPWGPCPACGGRLVLAGELPRDHLPRNRGSPAGGAR